MPTVPKAIRIRTPDGWQDISVIGPPGPPGSDGAQGPQGPAGPGIATGGTTDQLLAKNSATDYDTKWVAAPSGGGGGGGEIYEQSGEPSSTTPGAIWVDTDAPIPAAGGGAVTYTYATRPAAAAGNLGQLALITDEPLVPYKLQYSDGAKWFSVALGEAAPSDLGFALTRVSDGDTNGLIYYLGTRSGAFAQPVPNAPSPATSSDGTHLRVVASGTLDGQGMAIHKPVDRVDSTAWFSLAAIGSWYMLDLKTRMLAPNYLTLKSRVDANTNHPKSFALQGSSDGTYWSDLLTVTDAGYTAAAQWKSWPVTTSSAGFRYLRIVSTGPDTTGLTYLGFSEIELYGNLRTFS